MKIVAPGDRLRKIRARFGLTTRDVENASRAIAAQEGSGKYVISHSCLVRIENGEWPGIAKLYSLCAIYGMSYDALAGLFVNLDGLAGYQKDSALRHTRLIELPPTDAGRPPLAPGSDLQSTALLPHTVESWGEVPAGVLRHLDAGAARVGYIGLSDFTLYPILRPGSFVLVDEGRRKVEPVVQYGSEIERPIYFVETRDGCFCSWCEEQGERLVVVAHPASGCPTRTFIRPKEADVLGRVVAIAGRIAESAKQRVPTPLALRAHA